MLALIWSLLERPEQSSRLRPSVGIPAPSRALVGGGSAGCARGEAAVLVGQGVVGFGEHPTQLFSHCRGGDGGEGVRSGGWVARGADGDGNTRGAEGLREDFGDARGGVGVELVGPLVGASGVDGHWADVSLVVADLLGVPGSQVGGPVEEGASPVEGHGGDGASGEGLGRVVGQGLESRAARDLGVVGGSQAQEKVAFGVEVEGL